MSDILIKDSRLAVTTSFNEDKILLKTVLRMLSKIANAKITTDPYFSKEYVLLRFDKQKISTIMEAICCLYGTYWESQKNGYILRQTVHGIQGLLPKDPQKRQRMEALSDFARKLEKQPKSVKDKLSFSEGVNSNMPFKDIPSGLKKDVSEIISAHKEVQNGRDSKPVQTLYNNIENINIGFRVTSNDNSPFRKMEFMGYKDNAFFSLSISDVFQKVREQESALSPNNPNSFTYKITVLSPKEKSSKSSRSEVLSKPIDLDARSFTHPRFLAEIHKLAKDLNILTFVENFAMEKQSFMVRGEKVSDVFDMMCKKYSDLKWSMTRNDIVIFHVGFVD